MKSYKIQLPVEIFITNFPFLTNSDNPLNGQESILNVEVPLSSKPKFS